MYHVYVYAYKIKIYRSVNTLYIIICLPCLVWFWLVGDNNNFLWMIFFPLDEWKKLFKFLAVMTCVCVWMRLVEKIGLRKEGVVLGALLSPPVSVSVMELFWEIWLWRYIYTSLKRTEIYIYCMRCTFLEDWEW